MQFLKILVVVIALSAVSAWAQGPGYKLGKTATAEEVKTWDTSVGPEGKELPAGKGTAAEGEKVFTARGCTWCHGPTGEEGPAPHLVGGGIAGWAFATSIWDYINRAMPLNHEGSLTPNEVYSLTAYLLNRNKIIQPADVLDQATLPKVQMPNRGRYIAPPVDQWKPGTPRPFKIEP